MGTTHSLGFATGKLFEHGDGTVSYRAPGKIFDSFKVRISDVTGVSETFQRGLTNKIVIYGRGVTLVEFDGNAGLGAKLDTWFRARPECAPPTPAPIATAAAEPSMAQQIADLAALRNQGILTESEFTAAKARLID